MKLCECGCGLPAPIARGTDRRHGYVKGQPTRFINGHHGRKHPVVAVRPCACGCGETTAIHNGSARLYVHGHNAVARLIVESDYVIEERGYETPCWIWRHALHDGRGHVTVRGRKMLAYRAHWEQEIEPLSPGEILHHRCEVESCIRLDHLEPMTQSEHIVEHGVAGWNRKRHGPTLRP